ncbi:MAG: dihydrolipoyl dehydrogenase [Nitrospirota bacterium]|nr:dihydrolipoyl dehydrogenase [Nitrospirota bacterium]
MRLTIIGAGPGGYVAALRAAHLGAQVTVLERDEVGGTCLNWGCIPTKTLIASVEAFERVKHAGDFGIDISGTVTYNLEKIRDRKNKVVATQVKGIKALFKSAGVDLIPSRAELLSKDVVRAVLPDGTTRDIMSDRVIIATGSRPAGLPDLNADGDVVMTSDDALKLAKVPRSILIIGAGVIGCEFAFIYRSLGADVTVVETASRPLTTEDEDISAIIEREMKKTKIKLLTGVSFQSMTKTAEGVAKVRLSDDREIPTDTILLSIGRKLNSGNLGLDLLGIATGKRGEIVVNDRMETTVKGIFAIGDVTGGTMLAHVASHQGLAAAENALGGHTIMDPSIIPAGIFTSPEIGSVGLREHQARERKVGIKVGRFPYRGLGKAHAMGEIAGFVKIIAEAGTDKVLGVHICGSHATDLVHEGALAIRTGTTASELGHMIHAHPTLAEGIMEAANDVHGEAIHVQRESR